MTRVALTFDDGPAQWTSDVLDILAAHRAHATFFVIGSLVEDRTDLVCRMVAEGHEVGNHSWSHPRLASSCDDDQVRDELALTSDLIAALCGVPPTRFRAPQYDVDARVMKIAARLGLRHTHGDVTPPDWDPRCTARFITAFVLQQARPGTVIGLHDGVPPKRVGVDGDPASHRGCRPDARTAARGQGRSVRYRLCALGCGTTVTSLGGRVELARALGPRGILRQRRLGARFKQVSAGHAARQAEEMWVEAATALGATAVRLSPTILEFRLGEARTRVAFRATTPLTDSVALELAGDKPVAYQVLSGAGLPVPAHTTVFAKEVATAEWFLRSVVPPVVVKPVVGSAGRGVVGGVRTMSQLRRAAREAGSYHRRVLIEQQVDGDTFRLLFLEGELLDVIRRRPHRMTGDGRSTVERLLVRRVRAPHRGGWRARRVQAVQRRRGRPCRARERSSGAALGSFRGRVLRGSLSDELQRP